MKKWTGGRGGSNNKLGYAVAANYFSISSPICSQPLVIPTSSPRVIIPPPRKSPANLPLAELTPSDTAIANTRASLIYLTHKAPCVNIKNNAHKVLVGTDGGPLHQSSALCNHLHTNLPITSVNIKPKFHNKLMGIGPLCDHDCQVVFKIKYVTVYLQDDKILLLGW